MKIDRTATLIVILAAILIVILAQPAHAQNYEPCQPGDTSLPCIPAPEPTPTPIIGQPCTSDAPWLCYAHQLYMPQIAR